MIHRIYTGSVEDELHHSGWNVCYSCHNDPTLKRDLLILPALKSAKVFIIDVGTDPRKPSMHKVSSNVICLNKGMYVHSSSSKINIMEFYTTLPD